jgi:hypothetical protein
VRQFGFLVKVASASIPVWADPLTTRPELGQRVIAYPKKDSPLIVLDVRYLVSSGYYEIKVVCDRAIGYTKHMWLDPIDREFWSSWSTETVWQDNDGNVTETLRT